MLQEFVIRKQRHTVGLRHTRLCRDRWFLAVKALCSSTGRVQTMLAVKGTAVVCQSLLALLPHLWPVSWVMVPILLTRWCAVGSPRLLGWPSCVCPAVRHGPVMPDIGMIRCIVHDAGAV